MNQKVKRRFIAGATCPSCERTDTLFLCADALNGAFECVECGHKEEPPVEKPPANQTTEPDGIQAVKFVDVGSSTANGD